ncbi:hypothetical protein Sste5346_010411 [Sporothrix stenoceras]|uniref:Uncharacterized protein n=1 Tax=Sporothrix stenoceras TaxID=5173 RepID=A0ABR3YFR4_9PEZI
MKPLSRSGAIVFFLAASDLASGTAAQPQCFHLDGSQVTDPGVVPCLQSNTNGNGANNNGAAVASMCCNIGRQTSRIKGRQAPSSDDSSITENASGQQQLFFTGPDICLDNGLCQLQLADAQTGRTATPIQFSRNSCTQPDWAGGCLRNVCSSVTADNAAMTPCGGGGSSTSSANQTTQWCCGSAGSSTTANCCAVWPNHPDAVLVPAVFGSSLSSSSSSPVGGSVNPPLVGPSGSGLPTTLSVSVGPGGVVSLVTVTISTGFGGTATSFPASRTFVGSRPATNSAPASTQAVASSNPSETTAATALGAVATGSSAGRNGSDNSDNGETTLVTGATGLNTQEVAGIVAGLVVVVVVLVSIACFTAENMYKKRQQRFRARRLDEAMKQTVFPVAKSRPLMQLGDERAT